MRTQKHIALVIAREPAYLNANTGDLVTPSEQEKLLDSIFEQERKFIFVEVYRNLGAISADTLNDLNDKAWQLALINRTGDIQCFMLRKNGKTINN